MNNILQFKNIGKNKRIFLVGNGPSLNDMKLDLLDREYSLAMNRISLIYPKTKWRPTYYIFSSSNCHDHRWGKEWSDSIVEASSEDKTTPIIWRKYKKEIESRSGLLPEKTVYLDSLSENPVGSEGAFSINAEQRIDKSGTTMNVALQLAYYMNFSEVYLIGCDSNWSTATNTKTFGDPNHFDSSYHAYIGDGQHEFNRMNGTHLRAKPEFDKAGIKIINAGLNSAITAYDKIDFNTLF
jgi:hypothetical protein